MSIQGIAVSVWEVFSYKTLEKGFKDMEDQKIIALYFQRVETAITETKNKYSRLLLSISYGILKIMADAEECENDTYLKTWNAIPPKKPENLPAFLSKIVRNLSLDRYDSLHAEKRGGGEMPLVLEELSEVLPDKGTIPGESNALSELIDTFLASLKPENRNIFMRRYWFMDSVSEIAEESGFGLSKVKMSLSRTREQLKLFLEQEGYRL